MLWWWEKVTLLLRLLIWTDKISLAMCHDQINYVLYPKSSKHDDEYLLCQTIVKYTWITLNDSYNMCCPGLRLYTATNTLHAARSINHLKYFLALYENKHKAHSQDAEIKCCIMGWTWLKAWWHSYNYY